MGRYKGGRLACLAYLGGGDGGGDLHSLHVLQIVCHISNRTFRFAQRCMRAREGGGREREREREREIDR